MNNHSPTCWVVTDGKAGMESQCVGLAEAMGLQPTIKRVRLRRLWRTLSPHFLLGLKHAMSRKGDALSAPWPDIVIATGRQSVLPSLYIKKMTGGKSFHVQIQNPVIPFSNFNQVIVPKHDGLSGPNVVSMEGALHRLNRALLDAEATKWAPHFAHLPRPYYAVLLGGNNAHYRLNPRSVMEFGPQLTALAEKQKGSLLITPSRRTGADATALLSALTYNTPHFLWNGEGGNPYYGMLGLADGVVVTCDSVNMISEACSTGKPVMVVKLPGHSDKFASFHRSLESQGRITFFNGDVGPPPAEPLDEMSRVAATVMEEYKKFK